MTDRIEFDTDVLADADDQQTLQMVVDFYYRHLLASDEMAHYLATKRLDDDAVIEHFRPGYANRTLGL